MLLNGLTNFFNELRIDSNSFLHDYYKKNKYLLADEEDDEEMDNEEEKQLDNNNSFIKFKNSKTFHLLDENKRNSVTTNPLKKMASVNIPENKNKEKELSKAKKPILPQNISDSQKSYYNSVDKVFETLLKNYELNDSNGKNIIFIFEI